MANGKPGDHPLTDILQWKHEVYGAEADELIRKISSLSSNRELDEWWEKEIGWDCKPNKVLIKANKFYEELQKRAEESGWESK